MAGFYSAVDSLLDNANLSDRINTGHPLTDKNLNLP